MSEAILEQATANIAAHLPRLAESHPDAPALAFPAGRGADGRRRWIKMSYGELDRESNRFARGLAAAGIVRGTRTVLMVPPSQEFFVLTFALFKVGAVLVMVDPGLGMKGLKSCLDEAEPEAFIGIPKAHAARIVFGWAKDSLHSFVTVGTRYFWGGRALRDIRSESDAPYLAATRHDETAAILFTSGSTGSPKGAVYSHAVFDAQVRLIKEMYGIEPGEIDVPTFPLFALFAPALGSFAVIPEMDFSRPGSADPRALVDAVREFGAQRMFGSPAVLDVLGRWLKEHGESLPTMKRILSAGAPVSPRILERFTGRLAAGARLHTPYGATECLPVASIADDEILGETRALSESGKGICVGKPAPGTAVKIIKIVDYPIGQWEDSLELGQGEIGEIVAAGPVATREYFNRPEAVAAAKIETPSGFWHRMGDLGYLDEKGRLWFCGRKSQRVETESGTLFTIPCEGIFNAVPGVFRTALVGVRGRPVLCVEEEKESPRERADLLKDLRAAAAAYPHTSGIETFLFHHGFPVDIRHNAKIFREKLALWAARRC